MILFLVMWVLGGVYAFGTTMAEELWRGRVDQETCRDQLGFCMIMALTGLIGAFVAALVSNFNQHGWVLWRRVS